MLIREAGDRACKRSGLFLYSRNQKMEGDVVWDSISNLKFKMTEGSILTGGLHPG